MGILTDNELNFKKCIRNLCRTAQYILHALIRPRKYLILEKAGISGSTFVNCRFNYVPLSWMFCRNHSYVKIEKIHYGTLKVICHSSDSYNVLLEQSNRVSIRLTVNEILNGFY